jgi:predicted dehydrogenase
VEGAECVAVYNRTRSKAEILARDFGVPNVYDNAEELLQREQLDFIDIITDVDTHPRFVQLAAEYKVAVICQKPMAPSLEVARNMVATCREANTRFFIHENWRWQTPIQQLSAKWKAAKSAFHFARAST